MILRRDIQTRSKNNNLKCASNANLESKENRETAYCERSGCRKIQAEQVTFIHNVQELYSSTIKYESLHLFNESRPNRESQESLRKQKKNPQGFQNPHTLLVGRKLAQPLKEDSSSSMAEQGISVGPVLASLMST